VPQSTTAELILVNAHLPETGPLQAVAVRGGTIAAIGDTDAVTAGLRDARTEVVDLAGATLLPGLTDSHIHPVIGAVELAAGTDLSRCRSLEEVRTLLAEAARTSTNGWVEAWGLDPNLFGSEPISHAAIEPALNGMPAAVRLFDGHALLAGRRALEIAGVDGPRGFASESSVVCDAEGRPTGHLLEMEAIALVLQHVPAPSRQQTLARIRLALAGMAATGLTGGHVMDAHGDSFALLDELEQGDADGLALRLALHPWLDPSEGADGVDGLIRLQGRAGRRWSVAGVKLFIDGTVDGGTAWLDAPDCHGESTRCYWPDPAEFTRAVRRLAAAGVSTATHAIGDAGVRHVLDALAGAGAGADAGADRAWRHRIEHIETLPAELVPRFAAQRVVASMQPTHCTDYTKADHSDNWSTRLGQSRADRGWPCRELADSGAVLALGSDWPIAPYDPRAVMSSARTRRPAADPRAAAHHPQQVLTARQALDGYTVNPARARGESAVAGRIAPGFRADLTVLADDPLTTPPADLLTTPVRLTVVDGRIIHRDQAL